MNDNLTKFPPQTAPDGVTQNHGPGVGFQKVVEIHDIGWAINIMRFKGVRVRRAGWNGKGMWLCYVGVNDYGFSFPIAAHDEPGSVKGLPWVGMKTADGGFVPWLCSQTDLLATDWELA